MAVLVECVSVIIREEAIQQKHPGGWPTFEAECPNQTLCADTEIVRIGFMTPTEVKAYRKWLEHRGFIFVCDGKAIDFAIADQLRGLTTPCDWLEFGHIELNGNRVAACRKKGSTVNTLATPTEWRYEGSPSQTPNFIPTNKVKERYVFLRSEDGLSVFLDRESGREFYTGTKGNLIE